MRAPIAALLTVIIFLNLFGFYLVFMVRQGEVKTEMTAKMQNASSSQFQVLSFGKSEFSNLHFSNDGKELTVDGKLYDIVNIEHKGNHTLVTVEYDSEETELVDGFVALFNGKSESGNGVPLKDFLQFLQKDFLPHQVANQFIVSSFSNTTYSIQSFYGSAGSFAGILVPPPCA